MIDIQYQLFHFQDAAYMETVHDSMSTPENIWLGRRSIILNTSELWTSILQRLPPVVLTVNEYTPNLSVSSVDCGTLVDETVWHPILIIGIFHGIACHRCTASDNIHCVSFALLPFRIYRGSASSVVGAPLGRHFRLAAAEHPPRADLSELSPVILLLSFP